MNDFGHDELCGRYWDLRGRVQADPEYARLRDMLEALEPEYEAILHALPEEDRLTLDRYITLRENMGRRMAEFCVSEGKET